MRFLFVFCLWTGLATAAGAKDIRLDIDISGAERMLEIACSGQVIDAAEWKRSPQLKAQLAHHAEFGERFSFENYIAGLEAITLCETPKPDPFRFSSLVEKRHQMEAAIGYLSRNKKKMTTTVVGLLEPYVPQEFVFDSQVVLSAASFSCGGFQKEGIFFIDIPCLSEDMEGNYQAIVKLAAHETYHAMQHEFARSEALDLSEIKTVEAAYDYMFSRLALEGSASHIGDMRSLEGEGRYTSFARSLARRNYRHLDYNFRLFNYMIEAIGNDPGALEKRFPEIYGLAFDGAFGEHSYFVGQQMTAELEHSYGPAVIPCLLALPYENYLLAYMTALDDGKNLEQSYTFSPATVKIARERQQTGSRQTGPGACVPARRRMK